jgi:type I restriction enzyme S subunit
MEVKAGFKQTDIGIFPNDWVVKSIKELKVDLSDGNYSSKYPKASDFRSIGVPFIRANNIRNMTVVDDDLRYISETQHAELLRGHLKKNDILITTRGEIGQIAFVPDRHIGSNINAQLVRINLDKTGIDGRYVGYVLSFDETKKRFEDLQTGSALKQLPVGKLITLVIPIPPTRTEQKAIAEALSDADALIEALEGLIAKKRQVKQGAMQELLSGRKRLPGFSGEWKPKSLGELGSTFGGLTGKTKSDFGHGTSSYITFMNIMSNVVIDCKTFEMVDIKPTETQNRVKKGDLFFNGSSETPEEVGMCAVLLEDVQGVFLNSFCFGFRFREDAKVNGLYFAYFFRSREGRELLKSLAQGATRYNLSKTALLRLNFPIPDEKEQTAIAEILNDMDAEITALEEKLSTVREVKAGMMSELLTGRIRLVES